MQGICLRNFKSSELKGEEKGLLKISIGRTCKEVNFALDQLRPLYLLISQGHRQQKRSSQKKQKRLWATESFLPITWQLPNCIISESKTILWDTISSSTLYNIKRVQVIYTHLAHFDMDLHFDLYWAESSISSTFVSSLSSFLSKRKLEQVAMIINHWNHDKITTYLAWISATSTAPYKSLLEREVSERKRHQCCPTLPLHKILVLVLTKNKYFTRLK